MSDLSEISRKLDDIIREFLTKYEDGKYLLQLAKEVKEEIELEIDWRDVVEFDENFAVYFQTFPFEVLRKMSKIASEYAGRVVYITLKGVPEFKIRDIVSSDYIGRLIAFKGVVTKITATRPRLVKAVFTCPVCGAELTINEPNAGILKRPPKCDKCKIPMIFNPSKSIFEDFQMITVQERTEDIPTGSTPTSVDCLIKKPLIDRARPGEVVKIIGILKYSPAARLPVKISGTLDTYVEVVGIEVGSVEDSSLELTEEEMERIQRRIASGEAVEVVKNSVAPGIRGYDEIKEAVAYQLFGGVNKTLPDGTTIRGNIHILLIGDPGIGKSQILRSVASIAPRAIYTTGEGSTGAGLTVAAIRGESGFTLEAGALVLADNGIACIDEFDKMRAEDRKRLHEAMEQQSFHPDTEILLVNGERKRLGELVEELMMMFSDEVEETENGKYLKLPPFVAIYVPSHTLSAASPMKVIAVSKHKAPKTLLKITLESGNEITVTPEHPFLVLNPEGEIEVKSASALNVGDKIPVTNHVFIYESPGTINENLARIIARFLIDGILGEKMIAVKRIPEEFDKIDRNWVKETFPDVKITKDDDYVWIRSMILMDFLHDHCEELFDRRIPAALVRESPTTIAAFLEEFFIASSGRVDDLKLAEDMQLLFARLGKAAKIYERNGKYTLQFYDERPDYREVSKIVEVESDTERVYDVVIEPTHLLVIGSGAILHNSISVSKAGITARLNARTAILAAANPKFGRFIKSKPLNEQIDLPPPILSRFDLIFPLLDVIDENHDREIAEHIGTVWSAYESIEIPVPPKLLKKRIYYARNNIEPRIPQDIAKKVTEFYVKVRQSSKDTAVKITPRQLESIFRLAEARARLHLRNEVTEEDINAAIRLVSKYITDVLGGDIDTIYGMPTQEREKVMKIDEAIKNVLEAYGAMRERELIEEVKKLTGEDEAKIKKYLRKLYEAGEIIQPEMGVYSL